MIYLKRFCFCIVVILCVVVGLISSFVEIIISPIWMAVVYIITGSDPMCEDGFYGWTYSMKFLDWYGDKFGPNDVYKIY